MADDNAPTCPIEGNSDLYGLGVRLGLYLQFIALVLARPSAKRAFDAINTSTIAFILANFVVLIQQSSLRELYAPEAYLLFYLLVPQLVVNVFGTNLQAIDYRGVIAILLWGAFCFYYSWFWWVGLDVLKRSTCEDEFGFFFTKVSLRGWFRTFNKVIWTFANIAFGVTVLIVLTQLVYRIFRARSERQKAPEREDEQLRTSLTVAPTEDRGVELPVALHSESVAAGIMIQQIFMQFWSLIPFAIFVSGAEVTLRYNNIQDVNTVDSASQLIPLVLALGLLVHVISKTLRKLGRGFRHAFDQDAEEHADGEDRDTTRDEFRRELLEERGWLGAIGRFLFRIYCALVVGYNQAEGEEEEPNQSGSGSGCPKSGQYSVVDVELQSGTRPSDEEIRPPISATGTP
ncbi:hypothetical protein F4820DRAFT_469917 [Hypoxylon rubiginosum]|uniref:Uncharacterized protein n=1 Tax=Hypoxylon rubiginosum TaxID=110542 RepID=A0ACB9Z0L2_9PEZI|nr:hypothetical protein F4820DRAFT_469917 [Hypoxylon rubiginosum]